LFILGEVTVGSSLSCMVILNSSYVTFLFHCIM